MRQLLCRNRYVKSIRTTQFNLGTLYIVYVLDSLQKTLITRHLLQHLGQQDSVGQTLQRRMAMYRALELNVENKSL